MKISIYIDTENQSDVKSLAKISDALNGKRLNQNDLEKLIKSVVFGAKEHK